MKRACLAFALLSAVPASAIPGLATFGADSAPTNDLRQAIEGVADVPVDRTRELQEMIDRVSAAGGGEVRLGKGVHTAGGIFLKDGVMLRLDAGAVLQAVTNLSHYPHTPGWDRGAVVMADGATDISVVGEGTIDGRGDRMPILRRVPGRWRGVAFNRCRNVRIEGVKIVNPMTWSCYLKACDGVVVRDVTIHAHANLNNDGLDIESSNVLVEGCDVDSEDDALVFKTTSRESVVTNVTVRNCRLSSNSSFIKVGTETRGVFRDIRVSDCRLEVRTPLSRRSGYGSVPGCATNQVGLDGIGVSIFDGGSLDGFTAERITMGEGIGVPVFIRIGQSERVDDTVPGGSFLRNVVLRDVTMEKPAVFRVPSSVTGVAAYDPWWRFWKRPVASLRPQNVRFENVTLRTAADFPGDAVADDVDEMAASYPVGKMFANEGLAPANALYVRHADGVVLSNIRVLREPGPTLRETFVAEDADVSGR